MGNFDKVEIDDRGRLTIPAHIRKNLSIRMGDTMSILVNQNEEIVLISLTQGLIGEDIREYWNLLSL